MGSSKLGKFKVTDTFATECRRVAKYMSDFQFWPSAFMTVAITAAIIKGTNWQSFALIVILFLSIIINSVNNLMYGAAEREKKSNRDKVAKAAKELNAFLPNLDETKVECDPAERVARTRRFGGGDKK